MGASHSLIAPPRPVETETPRTAQGLAQGPVPGPRERNYVLLAVSDCIAMPIATYSAFGPALDAMRELAPSGLIFGSLPAVPRACCHGRLDADPGAHVPRFAHLPDLAECTTLALVATPRY